ELVADLPRGGAELGARLALDPIEPSAKSLRAEATLGHRLDWSEVDACERSADAFARRGSDARLAEDLALDPREDGDRLAAPLREHERARGGDSGGGKGAEQGDLGLGARERLFLVQEREERLARGGGQAKVPDHSAARKRFDVCYL